MDDVFMSNLLPRVSRRQLSIFRYQLPPSHFSTNCCNVFHVYVLQVEDKLVRMKAAMKLLNGPHNENLEMVVEKAQKFWESQMSCE